MATGYNIRVGDAEREASASQLREHYADGRLTLEELNERLDEAFAAKTRADLNAVMRDLPLMPRPIVPAGGSRSGRSGSGSSRSGSSGSSGSGFGSSGSGRRGFALLAPVFALFWLCLVLGGVFLFGFGDKPVAIVLLLAALAFLRKLFGRRRRGRGRGRCGR